jgi:glycosyltransferase involved in cell wall biosynthesis
MENGISLCMIVKNEADWLGKCLASARNLADEMIVVDTGSTDDTKRVASEMGANVFDFEWNNNFSDARNFSISKATRKWILVLDADDVISERDVEAIKSLTRNKHYDGFSFLMRNYTNNDRVVNFLPVPEGDAYEESSNWRGWDLTRCVRMFRNLPHIRFERDIHEVVDYTILNSGGRILKVNVPIHHLGEAKTGKQAPGKRESLYSRITRKRLESYPDDPKDNFTMAFECFKAGNHDDAMSYYMKAIQLKPDYVDAYIGISQACVAAGRLEDAIAVNEEAAEKFPNVSSFFYNLGELYLAKRDHEKALDNYQKALELNSPQKERIEEKIRLIRSQL